MKKFYLILKYILVCLLTLIVWNSWNTKNKYEDEVLEFESKIKELQVGIDSLNQVNNLLEVEADSLINQIELTDLKITKLNTSLDDLKLKKSEIPNIVNRIGDDELEEFFTNRYGFHKNQNN
jgi:hypothetical protein